MSVDQLTPADLIQLRKHSDRTLYAAACVLGVRLASTRSRRPHKNPNYAILYRVEGVPQTFLGIKPLQEFLRGEGVRMSDYTLRTKLAGEGGTVSGFRIHNEGQVRRQVHAVVLTAERRSA